MLLVKGRSQKRIVFGSLVAVLVLLMAAVPHLIVNLNSSDDQIRVQRNLAANDSNFYKYAYVIVTYHKSGHVLSRHLAKYLQDSVAFQIGSRLVEGERVKSRRNFDPDTKCTQLSLVPGTVTIIDAPEFHCKSSELRRLFMHNPDPARKKFGVKVIHLVRNPFSMAVSNYHFHSQDPTPEPFVHTVNPCESLKRKLYPSADVVVDLVTPKLTNTKVEISGEMKSIMTHEDFDNITKDCYSLWRSKPGLTDGTYFDHLRALDPKEGVRMATADRFIHFALLASDLIMFDRVKKQVAERHKGHAAKHNHFDLITMPLDDWIEQPDQSMYGLLNFIFHDHVPDHRKRHLAAKYKKEYTAKSLRSEHVTHERNSNTASLIESLRKNEVFGGPLSRIEILLEYHLRNNVGRDEAT